jgi:hypothetical protein
MLKYSLEYTEYGCTNTSQKSLKLLQTKLTKYRLRHLEQRLNGQRIAALNLPS